MLRVILCMTCCSVPPNSRSHKKRISQTKGIGDSVDPETLISITANGKPTSDQKFEKDDQKSSLVLNQIGIQNLDSSNEVNADLATHERGSIVLSASTSSQKDGILSVASDNKVSSQYEDVIEYNEDEIHSGHSSASIVDIAPNDDNKSDITLPSTNYNENETSGSQTKNPNEDGRPKEIQATTKIGDYARLEYSPVDDLESVTTMSYSRVGSEKSINPGNPIESANGSRRSSFKSSSDNKTRRMSEGGIESTSISITSQLSSENIQHNFPNVLELANNSPLPSFGTIGLPLGPPIDGNLISETAKTSPETTGAALTSASQDSLSSSSLGSGANGNKQQELASDTSIGCALATDSIEESTELTPQAPIAMVDDELILTSEKKQPIIKKDSIERIESPLSIATTTSGGLPNPTPTPSELSGSSVKKNKKLRAKSLLKKLKLGSKKNKVENLDVK